MKNIRRSVSSLLLVVAFLVLTALTVLIYNTNSEQKEQLNNNPFYQKAKSVGEIVLFFSKTLADANLNKNIGFGQEIKDKITVSNIDNLLSGGNNNSNNSQEGNSSDNLNSQTTILEPTAEETNDLSLTVPETVPTVEPILETNPSFWSRIKQLFQTEWQKSQTDSQISESSGTEAEISNLFFYQKTETGAEIIIRPKTGAEYKLPLPFKFLSL